MVSDLAQLKARQRDVRSLHPEDMMQNDILVRPLAAQQQRQLNTVQHQCIFQHASHLYV